MSALEYLLPSSTQLTQVLHILISEQEEGGLANVCTWSYTGTIGFEHDDAVGCDRRDKSQSVGERCPFRVVVECEVGEAISEDGDQEGKVS